MPSQSWQTAQLWEVVGGVGKGGILVREGKGIASAQKQDRLSTGAIVRQLCLEGERLQYQRLRGAGPDTGWVSIMLKEKDLLIRTQDRELQMLSPPSASLEKIDTKLSGTIDLATLDQVSEHETSAGREPVRTDREKLGAQAVSQLEGMIDASGIPDIRSHVAKIVKQTRDLHLLTPKVVTNELAKILRRPADEMKQHMALIKYLAQVEVKLAVIDRMQAPLDIAPVRFTIPALSASPSAAPPRLAPEGMEPIVAQHLSDGNFEQALKAMSDQISEFTLNSAPTTNSKPSLAALLIVRGHLYWTCLYFMKAHGDFVEAERLQPGGGGGASLLVLRFCLGLPLMLDDVAGCHELKVLIQEAFTLYNRGQEAIALRRHLFHPRSSNPIVDCNTKPQWACPGMRIYDGTCKVEAMGDDAEAEIGYRILHNENGAEGQTPLLVYYHGNGEICEDYTGWANVYQKFPCSFMVFDYRGYGWSTGQPTMTSLTNDPNVCMRKLPSLLEKHRLPWPWPAPVILMGRSLGTRVVGSLIGQFPDMFDGLICDSGAASSAEQHHTGMLESSGPHREEAASAFEAMRRLLQNNLPPGCPCGPKVMSPHGTCDGIQGYRGPVLVLHGRNDTIVPPENGQRNYDAAINACWRELEELPADHNSLAGVPTFWQIQMRFLRKVVQHKKSQH